jgi:hypothetical protein
MFNPYRKLPSPQGAILHSKTVKVPEREQQADDQNGNQSQCRQECITDCVLKLLDPVLPILHCDSTGWYHAYISRA